VLAFPVEVPKEQYLSMIKEFCQEQFVSKGMIADFAIHDKEDGNPHAHILLTLRAMDEHGKWLPKARKVYDLDENGERIRLPSGNWKCHKENTVDWNDQKYAEVWRHSWETITNRYLEAAGRPERVDLRSFERQDIQQIHHHIAHIHARIGKPSIPFCPSSYKYCMIAVSGTTSDINSCKDSGTIQSSESRKRIHSPCATFKPEFLAADGPPFSL
jgi:ATP-dependent exoDNAse (exonuclease V) alpha subunit